MFENRTEIQLFKNLTIESSFTSALCHFMNGSFARAFLTFGLIYWYVLDSTYP